MSWFAAIAMAPVVEPARAADAPRCRDHPRDARLPRSSSSSSSSPSARCWSTSSPSSSRGSPTSSTRRCTWVNTHLRQSLTLAGGSSPAIGGGSVDFGSIASTIGSNLLGILGSVLGSVFGLFTFAPVHVLLLRRRCRTCSVWIASLFPARSPGRRRATCGASPREKTGGYVGARVVLGAINAVTTRHRLLPIGLPYWLPLALWTGVVAQFVPTIGTYIAIVLPVLVGLLSPSPWIGVAALVWAPALPAGREPHDRAEDQRQGRRRQPRRRRSARSCSARRCSVSPAPSSPCPVVAMLLALLDIYGHRYELASDEDLDGVPDVQQGEIAGEPAT